jgi:hypothetical protein
VEVVPRIRGYHSENAGDIILLIGDPIHVTAKAIRGRDARHVLARFRGLRERRIGRLTVLTMAYAIGHISGCHLNPAVTVGLVVAKRFPASEMFTYILAQVIGACIGAGILFVIATG